MDKSSFTTNYELRTTNSNYNQRKAMLAVTVASLRSIMRSPSAVVFSILFPLIFIVVFGFIVNNNISVSVGIHPVCDTTNQIYDVMKSRTVIELVQKSLHDVTT